MFPTFLQDTTENSSILNVLFILQCLEFIQVTQIPAPGQTSLNHLAAVCRMGNIHCGLARFTS